MYPEAQLMLTKFVMSDGDDVSDDNEHEEEEHIRELNRVLQMYNNAILQERNYIMNTTMNCGNLFQIHCGLSPARNFQPSIKIEYISNVGNNISFSTFEWSIFMNHLNWMLNEYFTSTIQNPPKLTCGENIEILGITYNGNKMVSVVMDAVNHLCFTQEDVKEIVKIDSIFRYKIDMLNAVNFSHYYHNTLNVISDLLKSTHVLNPLEVLNSFCNISSSCSIHDYCLRECLYFNKDKVLNDLDRK